jgi:broad specificity phosphatase PhoE
MRLIFVRHCETDWNTENRLQGHTDTELNRFGISQADKLGRELARHEIHRIVSSDLKRAVQTADIITSYLGVPVHVDARLRETSFGSLEGMKPLEAAARYQIVPHYSVGPYDFRKFGGEERGGVLARHRELLDELVKRHGGETVMLVGHGAGLNILLTDLGHEAGLNRGDYRVLTY